MEAQPQRDGICVFSPSPLSTVTVEQGGEAPEVHFHAGGQGFWVARMASVLGARTTLCAPFGGEPGRVLRLLIEAEQVEVRAIECVEANGGYIHDRSGGGRPPCTPFPPGPRSPPVASTTATVGRGRNSTATRESS